MIVFAIDGGIAPLDGHAGDEGGRIGAGGDVAQDERGHFFHFPAPMVGSNLNRLHGGVAVPGFSVGAAGGQVDFKSLEDGGQVCLELPDILAIVGCEEFFRLADHGCAYIDGGGPGNAHLLSEERDLIVGVAALEEVGVFGGVLLFVGCDGPGIEVVDLLVYVVDDGADALIAALGLEDANGLAPAFNCAALAIDGLEMLIVMTAEASLA